MPSHSKRRGEKGRMRREVCVCVCVLAFALLEVVKAGEDPQLSKVCSLPFALTLHLFLTFAFLLRHLFPRMDKSTHDVCFL